ncbi:MAG: nucleotide-binding protein, partial [Kofleriaceae bacterium]
TNTEEMFLAKFSQAGSCVWAKNFNAHAADLMVNAAGDVSVTGWFSGSTSFGGQTLSSAGSNDVFVARFDGAGEHLNSVRAGGTADERGAATTQASDGRFFVTGGFSGFAEFGDEAFTSAGGDDAFVFGLAPL